MVYAAMGEKRQGGGGRWQIRLANESRAVDRSQDAFARFMGDTALSF